MYQVAPGAFGIASQSLERQGAPGPAEQEAAPGRFRRSGLSLGLKFCLRLEENESRYSVLERAL